MGRTLSNLSRWKSYEFRCLLELIFFISIIPANSNEDEKADDRILSEVSLTWRTLLNWCTFLYKTYHTVILPDWTLKKWGLSNFPLIGTQDKKIFWIPVRNFWGPHYQGMAIPALSEKLPKWHFLICAWNLKFFWTRWLLAMLEDKIREVPFFKDSIW